MKTDPPSGQASEQTGDAASEREALPAPLAMIVGLGNPGPEYADHRHNVGFQIVDSLAKTHGLVFARHKKAKARVAEGQIGERTVLLAKPQTFMNLSGRSVLRLSREHEITPEQILVVCDDLDLPLGRLRIRPRGGSGGHRGLRSIIELLDSQDFSRLRVGIDRPTGNLDPAEYVLRPITEEDSDLATDTLERAAQAVETWLEDGIVAAMDRFNRPPPPAGEATDVQNVEEHNNVGEPELPPLSSADLPVAPGPQERGT